jgi:hypothetical protein
MKLPASQRCSEKNRYGQPCRAKAIKDGRCAMHSGLSDPRAMGRKLNGKARMTKLRREVAKDEQLLQRAKGVLAEALDGDDEKRRFEAATRLVSFRAAQPPAETAKAEHSLYRPHSLHSIVLLACERHVLGIGEELENAVAEALAAKGSDADYGEPAPKPKVDEPAPEVDPEASWAEYHKQLADAGKDPFE